MALVSRNERTNNGCVWWSLLFQISHQTTKKGTTNCLIWHCEEKSRAKIFYPVTGAWAVKVAKGSCSIAISKTNFASFSDSEKIELCFVWPAQSLAMALFIHRYFVVPRWTWQFYAGQCEFVFRCTRLCAFHIPIGLESGKNTFAKNRVTQSMYVEMDYGLNNFTNDHLFTRSI